jgi:hypothetical protein
MEEAAVYAGLKVYVVDDVDNMLIVIDLWGIFVQQLRPYYVIILWLIGTGGHPSLLANGWVGHEDALIDW